MTNTLPAPSIHPTAIVAEGAVLGEGTTVGAYSIIGPNVVVGRGTKIGPHVVLEGHTVFGDDNVIFQFASIGSHPQDLKYRGEPSRLVIGSRNIIREYVTIQPGTEGGGMMTTVGNRNLFMANCHLGHDSCMGDNNIIANSAALSGHTVLGSGVTIGGLAAVHQFVRLGDLCFISGGAMVVKDIPPFCYAQGDRAGLAGINRVGLERRGISATDVALLKRLYRRVFFGLGGLQQRLQAAREEAEDNASALKFLDFIGSSQRGITVPRSKVKGEGEDD